MDFNQVLLNKIHSNQLPLEVTQLKSTFMDFNGDLFMENSLFVHFILPFVLLETIQAPKKKTKHPDIL